MRMLDGKGSLESEVLNQRLRGERVQRLKGVLITSHRRVLKIEDVESREIVLRRMLDESVENSSKISTSLSEVWG